MLGPQLSIPSTVSSAAIITESAADEVEPACPMVARPTAFEAIPRATWEALLARTPAATPFSRWTVHRAWWDAYGETAEPRYVLVTHADDPLDARGIVPLMGRHEVEPDDAAASTTLRPQPAPSAVVAPGASAIFFGASYHVDYATILAAAEDLPDVARAVTSDLASGADSVDWDLVDLRRLRADDPAIEALKRAFEAVGAQHGWSVRVEHEDVCPVVTLQPGTDWDTYLATLGRKARHEVRRKLRRAEDQGSLDFRLVRPDGAAIDRFIDLHQARWGAEGLFPDTVGGARSRTFVHRLAALELESEDPALILGELRIGERLVFSGLAFEDATTCYFYNAGTLADAEGVSPGVVGTAAFLRERLERGDCRRFDFLRGNEPYKYEWGARDEPILRLLVSRTSR
jgi:hypothetical protein